MGLGFPDKYVVPFGGIAPKLVLTSISCRSAESKSTPFFVNLAESGSLASNVFSFFMSRGGADGSELCIGCVNSDKFSGGAFASRLV